MTDADRPQHADDATPLDQTLAAMTDAPEDEGARLRFHERFADAELFLLLTHEADGDRIDPRIFDTGAGRFVAAFDREDRLAAFAGGIAPFAALPGRTLASLAVAEGLGVALNLGVTGGETLVAPDTLAWLVDTLSARPQEAEARPRDIAPPADLPERLLTGIDAKLAAMPGRARSAYLAAVTYDTGAASHLLAFVDAAPGAEGALATAIGEALAFSGLEAATLDVAFFVAHDPISARLARVALRFDLPTPEAPPRPAAPGSDPDRPPILRQSTRPGKS